MARPPSSAREIALAVLRRVRQDRAYSNLALSAALDRARPPVQERALATELVYGVLRHEIRLDHVLRQHSHRPLSRINADLRELLRVACYQLLLLDRVPAHAAVNEAVAVARATRGPQVAGFINAILRKVQPEDFERALPKDAVERAALQHSLPLPLAQQLHRRRGLDELCAFGEAALQRAALVVRCNLLRNDRTELCGILRQEGAAVELGRWCDGAVVISGLEQPFASRSFFEGRWTAQDEAAQLAAELAADRSGAELTLDLCAGVGGKSTLLLERAPADRVISVDSSAQKLQLLQEHCRRLGLSSEVLRADLTDHDALAELHADRVLLDAPCSGLGLIRRHPELKGRWAPGKTRALVALQRQLIETALTALRPGGTLVYSVCTITDEEGPQQARWMLEQHPDLALDPPQEGALAELWGDSGVTLWPQHHHTDGFFMTRLTKQGRQ